DIPGYWIPQMYFDYLRTQNAYPLQPIFYHNQCDILALVAFLTKLLQLFENPLQQGESLLDLLSVGKVYEDLQEFAYCSELYAEMLKTPGFNGSSREIRFRQALNHKRLEDWTRAAEIWHECMSYEAFHPLPFIELAKHYEHRLKKYPDALDLVNKALKEIEIVEAMRPRNEWQNYRLDLAYRRRRLTRKI
ncbi:ribonuclease H-like domain-containing protein, partial [bacterium]|nr:ribonuclease H-like domain-containing protein [bacterium]